MLLTTRKSMDSRIAKSVSLGLLVGGLTLAATLAATWSGSGPSALAQESLQAQQLRPLKIARTLPGSRTGMITEAKGARVLIDHANYVLASDALIEDQAGNQLLLQNLSWNEVELPVRYWLGTGGAQNLITQMIVTLAE
jgi:hypothetical protein